MFRKTFIIAHLAILFSVIASNTLFVYSANLPGLQAPTSLRLSELNQPRSIP